MSSTADSPRSGYQASQEQKRTHCRDCQSNAFQTHTAVPKRSLHDWHLLLTTCTCSCFILQQLFYVPPWFKTTSDSRPLLSSTLKNLILRENLRFNFAAVTFDSQAFVAWIRAIGCAVYVLLLFRLCLGVNYSVLSATSRYQPADYCIIQNQLVQGCYYTESHDLIRPVALWRKWSGLIWDVYPHKWWLAG